MLSCTRSCRLIQFYKVRIDDSIPEKRSYFLILPFDNNFLFLEVDQPNFHSLNIVSYMWRLDPDTINFVIPHTCQFFRVVVHQKLIIIQTKSVWYFFDVVKKQCLQPIQLPKSNLSHAEFINSGYVRMITETKSTFDQDYYIAIPNVSCNPIFFF